MFERTLLKQGSSPSVMPLAKRRRGDDEKSEDVSLGATPSSKKRRRGIQYDPVS